MVDRFLLFNNTVSIAEHKKRWENDHEW